MRPRSCEGPCGARYSWTAAAEATARSGRRVAVAAPRAPSASRSYACAESVAASALPFRLADPPPVCRRGARRTLGKPASCRARPRAVPRGTHASCPCEQQALRLCGQSPPLGRLSLARSQGESPVLQLESSEARSGAGHPAASCIAWNDLPWPASQFPCSTSLAVNSRISPHLGRKAPHVKRGSFLHGCGPKSLAALGPP